MSKTFMTGYVRQLRLHINADDVKVRYVVNDQANMIKAVLFDLDETLLDRASSLKAFLADQYARYRDRLGAALFDAWRDRFLVLDARGSHSKALLYPQLLTEFSGDAQVAASLLTDYRERCSLHARPFAGMSETLSALRKRGLSLGIITNGETEFQSRHIAALGLSNLVDEILISDREGLRKPDAAIFIRAARRLSVEPSECLFVGDNPIVDILGAYAAGMQTAWFRCRYSWPANRVMPGPAIDRLSDVLALID